MSEPPRLVCLKFSVNEDLVPHELGKLKQPDYREVKFHGDATGIKLIAESVQSCSVAEFHKDLGPLSYEFVDAKYERRPDPNGGKKIYHTPCYFFSLREFARMSKEFEGKRYTLYNEFQILGEENMYAVRSIWDNPLYGADGQPVDNQRALEINLNMRQPLVDADGEPLLVWKDKSKQVKTPLKPKNYLRMMLDYSVEIVPA